MKKFLMLFIVMAVMLSACVKNEDDENKELFHFVTPFIEFSSLDNFLNACLVAKEGGCIADFMAYRFDINEVSSDYWNDFPRKVVEDTKFTALETFYLPVGIPEGFIIRRIIVGENGMGFIYLPEDVEFTSDTFWIAELNNPSFKLSVYMKSRFNMNDILRDENKTIDDLINGKYLIDEPNLFTWEDNGIIFVFHTPSPSDDGIEADSIYDMLKYTEMRVVNLLDIDEVMALLGDSAIPPPPS